MAQVQWDEPEPKTSWIRRLLRHDPTPVTSSSDFGLQSSFSGLENSSFMVEQSQEVLRMAFAKDAVTVAPARTLLLNHLQKAQQRLVDMMTSNTSNEWDSRKYEEQRRLMVLVQSCQFAADVLGGYVDLHGVPIDSTVKHDSLDGEQSVSFSALEAELDRDMQQHSSGEDQEPSS